MNISDPALQILWNWGNIVLAVRAQRSINQSHVKFAVFPSVHIVHLLVLRGATNEVVSILYQLSSTIELLAIVCGFALGFVRRPVRSLTFFTAVGRETCRHIRHSAHTVGSRLPCCTQHI
jgi:hypothetical protein